VKQKAVRRPSYPKASRARQCHNERSAIHSTAYLPRSDRKQRLGLANRTEAREVKGCTARHERLFLSRASGPGRGRLDPCRQYCCMADDVERLRPAQPPVIESPTSNNKAALTDIRSSSDYRMRGFEPRHLTHHQLPLGIATESNPGFSAAYAYRSLSGDCD